MEENRNIASVDLDTGEIINNNEDTSLIPKEEILLDLVKEKDNQLIEDILKADDPEKLKDLTHVFNAFQTKRQVLRVNALNDVQDALVAQMNERLSKTPHNFNNNDIANWMRIVQQSLDASKNDIKSVDNLPTIAYQQNNQINVNVASSLSRESREKITDVLKKFLSNVNNSDSNVVLNNDSNDISEESPIIISDEDSSSSNDNINNNNEEGDN